MNRWIAIAVVAGLATAWLAAGWMESRQAAEQVRQLQERRAASTRATPEPQEHPLDRLARENRGMRPPNDLVVAKIDTEGIWFVGKYEDGGGVEIPFIPGQRPQVTDDQSPHQPNPGYVGPDACVECHQSHHETFVETAHFRTSQPVTEATIEGRFQPGQNVMRTKDPNVWFEMIRRDDKFLQRTHFFNWAFDVPMQIIMGSSKMAQTHLYWHGDGLYQCNVTHITDGDQWINSPGYIDGDAAFARPVPERCMDCHTTYFDIRERPNHYTPDSIIFGVTCERCHGPAADHVAYHRENPEVKEPHAITNPSKLERERQIEVCGQCHSGSASLRGPALRYRPGDELMKFYFPPDENHESPNSVHTSNQLTRLAMSECYQATEMTCIDCHNPHHNERDDVGLFSQRCLTCHETEESCGLFPHSSIDLKENCIDCHMPSRPTKDLRLQSTEGDVFPPLRDHLIRIDQKATQQFLDSQK